MEIYLQFIILGIGAGVIYAALGLGLVMTYRASGVINFAYGAIAAYAAYVFAGLETEGIYPIPPLPNPLVIVGVDPGALRRGVAGVGDSHLDRIR